MAKILEIKKQIKKQSIQYIYNMDLISNIWSDRPKLPFSILYKLDNFFSGFDYDDKLLDVHEKLYEANADMLILSALEDQAWLYNLRGNDIANTPVFLAYTIITPDSTILFIDQNKIGNDIKNLLEEVYKFQETAKNIV